MEWDEGYLSRFKGAEDKGRCPVGQLDRPAAPLAASSAAEGGRSVLAGAFGLLAAVERAGAAGLTRLASDSGLPKTTAHRLLQQLVDLGAVEHGVGGYRMGPRMFRLGQDWQPYPGLRSAAREPARRLARATGTMVGVSALREGQTQVVDRTVSEPDEAFDRLRANVSWPWFTAAGKVLVAGAHPRLPLGPMPATWRREAAAIRDTAVAYDRGEVVTGMLCVAVPLHGRSGTPVAALFAVTDPAHRLDRLADAVQCTGRTISAGLRGR